jgi:hypothetical protein
MENAFHHSAIRWILTLKKYGESQEQKNKKYQHKVREKNHLPKKLMGAWTQCPRKLGQPQKILQKPGFINTENNDAHNKQTWKIK